MAVPTRCLEDNTSNRSILLGGHPISIAKVGRETGISPSYLSRILTGERDPSASHMKDIADAIGVSVDDLMFMIRERKDIILAECRQRLADAEENRA